MSMRVEHRKPHIGSIVYADKTALLDADTVARCQELLERRGILVFPPYGRNSIRTMHRTSIAGDEAVN